MSTTAADLSKDQLKRYHPFQSEKGPDPSSEAKKVAAQIARYLGERYGAKKVFLFGSLARDEQGPAFDIDLVGVASSHDPIAARCRSHSLDIPLDTALGPNRITYRN